jgi:Tfp pilus assembly protein FimT
MAQPRRRSAGFSIFELVLVIVVFGLVSAAAAPFVNAAFRGYFTGKDVTEMDWQARVASERMSRELRTIRAPADLTITAAGDITFVDLDGNTIRYCLGTVGTCPGAAGELMRNTQPLATGISALSFTYLNNASAATAVPAQVYLVTVAFTATQNNASRAHQFTVAPRNYP